MPLTLVLISILAGLVCMHALYRLYRVIATEKPEWVNVHIPFERFYAGLPRICMAAVQFEVLKVAFSSRTRQLTSPSAAIYANRIRYGLPISMVAFYMAVFFS